MNRLYGYPSAGPTLGDLRGYGRFGELHDLGAMAGAEEEITISGIISGDTYQRLKALQSEIMQQAGKIGEMGLIADKATGPQREPLRSLWRAAHEKNLSARANYEKARDQYNSIADKIRTYSLRVVNPPSLSGMGALPALALYALVAFVGAVLINSFANLWAAARGDTNATRGYIDQFAELAKQTGVTIEKTGEAISRTAWAVLAVMGAWALYQFVKGGGLKRWTGTGGATSAGAAPALPMLKTAEGKVV